MYFTNLQIISYLRLCLAKSAGIIPDGGSIEHPCEHTPLVGRYLEKLFTDHPKALSDYLDIIMLMNRAISGLYRQCISKSWNLKRNS